TNHSPAGRTLHCSRRDIGSGFIVAHCQEFAAGGVIGSPPCTGVSLSALRNSGNIHAQRDTITSVPTPPIITAATGPNHWAVRPDSNSPNSFDVPIKIMS